MVGKGTPSFEITVLHKEQGLLGGYFQKADFTLVGSFSLVLKLILRKQVTFRIFSIT